MGSYSVETPKPWIETPCLYSGPLSRAAGCNIYLKLDNLQPSGSFKSRGIGYMMQRAAEASPTGNIHFYCSSGGNAGLACATSAATMGCRATIVVPTLAPAHMAEKLRGLGATVVQTGSNFAEADAFLKRELLAHDPLGVYVSPFDHPDIWAGAETLADEISAQMRRAGPDGGPVDVDAIVCNVGGGGMLVGILDGIERVWPQAPAPRPRVLAVETRGAHSLNASVVAGELTTLPAVTSIAVSLGAPRVAARAYQLVRQRQDADAAAGAPPQVVSAVVSDAEAVMGSARFLDDARLLVEVSCGATVSVAYNGDLRRHLGKGLGDAEWAARNVVLIVCGGSHTTLDMLLKYKAQFGV
ncbi:L-serine dehydratase [Gaeumannomyces tritici R3-111a-1]|uniref:L-serine ammonia-lyase n=1 Tax=Gaeumannomyces tritici (strain R3-111a-1) TaxID=644352 RepID=J3NY92_GAET3|nr:L-serine dehydratase [Gaeumannomyces tritici R3-111a-1]EJT76325.1 L-serine dehydratase [Gaeumannomyces tritici R3-111a-1]